MADVKVVVVDSNVGVSVCEEDVVVITGEVGPQGPRGTQVLSGDGNPSPTIGLIGDQYINTSTGYLFGPKTESGWGEGVQLGGNDANDLGQVHYQTSPSTIWNIEHTLVFIPNVIAVDFDGNVIEGDIFYVDDNNITITFTSSIVGAAYLS